MRLVYLADAPYVHTRRWVAHSVAAGWETHVISFRPAEIEGATVHYVDGYERLGRARYLVHARRIRRLVSELRPDVLHALHLTSYGFLAGLSGVHPSVVSVWGTDILEAPGWSPLHNGVTRFALARADHVTATGLRLASATLPYAPTSKQVTVIPYGVDMETFRPTREREAGANVVIGSVGRLSIEKGLDDLLRAAATLIHRGTRLRVLLVGDGGERRKLEKLARELEIVSLVEFRGEIAHAQVPQVLNELDVFAMPSRAEGFGVAALEAAATGLPVVATRVHGIPDVVRDGETGLLVTAGDVIELAEAIRTLASDATLRAAMGHAGRMFVQERYSWRDNCAQMDALYRRLLAPFTDRTSYGTVATT